MKLRVSSRRHAPAWKTNGHERVKWSYKWLLQAPGIPGCQLSVLRTCTGQDMWSQLTPVPVFHEQGTRAAVGMWLGDGWSPFGFCWLPRSLMIFSLLLVMTQSLSAALLPFLALLCLYSSITRVITASRAEYLALGSSLQCCCSVVRAGTNPLQRGCQLQLFSQVFFKYTLQTACINQTASRLTAQPAAELIFSFVFTESCNWTHQPAKIIKSLPHSCRFYFFPFSKE